MGGILRVGLMVLLAAVTGVGSAWGEKKEYKDVNGIEWEYEEIEAGATCSIGPKDRHSISGFVEIPGTVEVSGVSIKVVSIGWWAFSDCRRLTVVTIPGSVTRIESRAFEGCSGLTEVTIPGSVTEIEDYTFAGCDGLKEVTIPGSVTKIWDGAFSGCRGLKTFEVESENKNYCAENGVLFTKDKATLICYPGGKPEESYVIPGSVKVIEESAFSGCCGLKEVTIPGSVTKIWDGAFSGCLGLTAVTIPSSVTKIGGWAFSGCSRLTEVTIPGSVKEIGNLAFSGCRGLTAVTIPGSVTQIGERAFEDCSGLKSIEVESENKNYCAENGVLFTKDKATLICYPAGKPEESYTIPGSVTEIGERAFANCSGLKSVTIPSSVTEMGWGAFADCSGLTAVTIPGSVTEIGWDAFADCSGLTAVNIPSSVTEIGSGAFSGCSGLKSIEVESGNKNYCAESGVLFTKDKATLICYPGGKPEESYVIPSSVKKIGPSAFYGCSGLKSFEVESENKNLCTENGVLFTKDKAALICYPGGNPEESYTIPGSVKVIGWKAFSDCSGLTAVTIPSSVTEIGNETFKRCSGLNTVYWLADAKCSVGDDAFKEIASPATLYVRQGEKAIIEGNGKWWQVFSKIVEGYVVTLTDSDGTKLGEQLVEPNNGTATAPTAAPTKEGFTFVEWQLDGAKYDFSTPVTKDITLVAVWKKADHQGTAVESVQLVAVRVVRNPVGEVLELEGMERAARVEVYSVVGARVHAEALRGEPRVAIDARGWGSGVYVVRVVASDGAKTLRVVK